MSTKQVIHSFIHSDKPYDLFKMYISVATFSRKHFSMESCVMLTVPSQAYCAVCYDHRLTGLCLLMQGWCYLSLKVIASATGLEPAQLLNANVLAPGD